jgi:hypothetical protein
MTPQRRTFIITVSVIAGTLLSAGLLYLKRGGLGGDDFFLLGTNLVFSLVLIFCIGWFLVWRKKN